MQSHGGRPIIVLAIGVGIKAFEGAAVVAALSAPVESEAARSGTTCSLVNRN